MPSLLPGYEYDIFISYRQNDNRSGWVTEFVKNLNEELAATIKDPISVYFDANPHDGLLETHSVDKSLEGKLKCLIFIPVISQTYCDPKSFAWQHEFCAFNKLAKEDPFGRDIKLGNGNVASRILPIKIHELDDEDRSLLESEIGGPLRPIEFIFKSPGVNRPLLLHEEHPHDNLNKTFYRDQINKATNAIKGIIFAMKGSQGAVSVTAESAITETTAKPLLTRKGIVALITLFGLLGLVAYFLFLRPAQETNDSSDNSIAVLPFVNMSDDAGQDYFSDGMTEQIITNLAHINSLKVIARTSVMKFKKTDKSIAEIARELHVTHVLEGSILKSGDRIRVTAQLIAAKDETHVWAQNYDRPLSDIFTVQDEVSQAIALALQRRLTPGEFENIKSSRPANVEAYQHYLRGYFLHDVFQYKNLKEDFIKSENEFKKAIRLEPTYGLAFAGLADLYDTYNNRSGRGLDEHLKFEALRDSCIRLAIILSPNDPYVISVRAYSFFNKTGATDADLDSAFKYRRKAFAIAPNSAVVCDALSWDYASFGLYYQGLRLRERAIRLDPTDGNSYTQMGFLYTRLGEYDKANLFLEKALLMEPEFIRGLVNLLNLKLQTGEVKAAENAIQKIKSINPEYNVSWAEGFLIALRGEKEKALAKSDAWYVYMTLGMKREALDKLESTTKNSPVQIHYLNLKNSSFFDPLRAEPRFKKILADAKMRYEEYLKRFAN